MKSQAITRTVIFAMCAGLSLIASAVESEKALPDAAPAAPVEKSDTGAQQAAWEATETELLKALKEAVAAQKEIQKADTTTDWNAVETNVKGLIFTHATAADEAIWPKHQWGWVRAAADEIKIEKRRQRRDFTADAELAIIVALEKRLSAEVQAQIVSESAEAQASPDAAGDETLWKFRDKSGSRTTKPRYKGQEPIN
jgi:hypothetical protein